MSDQELRSSLHLTLAGRPDLDDAREAGVIALIKAEMRQQHVNQSELADRLGVNRKLVSQRLLGQTKITVRDLYAIADVLGLQARALLP